MNLIAAALVFFQNHRRLIIEFDFAKCKSGQIISSNVTPHADCEFQPAFCGCQVLEEKKKPCEVAGVAVVGSGGAGCPPPLLWLLIVSLESEHRADADRGGNRKP